MNPLAILKEVEADVKSFGSISGDIRAKLKSGVADLTSIRDEMDTLVETVMGKAKSALASLKTVADEVSKDADGDTTDTGSTVSPAAPVEVPPAGNEPATLGVGGSTSADAPAQAPTSVNDIVAAEVPEADASHIAAAVVAHDESVAAGGTATDAHAAAANAAVVAGADPDVAAKVADSIVTNPPSAPVADPAPAAV